MHLKLQFRWWTHPPAGCIKTRWKQQPLHVCHPQSAQALPGLIKWSATLCIVTAGWVLAVVAKSCGPPLPESGLSWWMGSLSPSNYRWIFRCIHYLCWPGFCGCVCVSMGYCYTGWTAGGQLVCVGEGGSRGSCFSSAVGSLQYSWAPWGSMCCAALRPALPLRPASLTPSNTITSVTVPVVFSKLTVASAACRPWCKRHSNFTFTVSSDMMILLWIWSFMEAVNNGTLFKWHDSITRSI